MYLYFLLFSVKNFLFDEVGNLLFLCLALLYSFLAWLHSFPNHIWSLSFLLKSTFCWVLNVLSAAALKHPAILFKIESISFMEIFSFLLWIVWIDDIKSLTSCLLIFWTNMSFLLSSQRLCGQFDLACVILGMGFGREITIDSSE